MSRRTAIKFLTFVHKTFQSIYRIWYWWRRVAVSESSVEIDGRSKLEFIGKVIIWFHSSNDEKKRRAKKRRIQEAIKLVKFFFLFSLDIKVALKKQKNTHNLNRMHSIVRKISDLIWGPPFSTRYVVKFYFMISKKNSIKQAANLCKIQVDTINLICWGWQKVIISLILNGSKNCHENKQRLHLSFITRLQWRTFIIHSLPCSAIHFNSSCEIEEGKLSISCAQCCLHNNFLSSNFRNFLSSLYQSPSLSLSIHTSLPFPFFLVHHFCAKCIFQYFHFAEFSSSSSCKILLRVVVQHLSLTPSLASIKNCLNFNFFPSFFSAWTWTSIPFIFHFLHWVCMCACLLSKK